MINMHANFGATRFVFHKFIIVVLRNVDLTLCSQGIYDIAHPFRTLSGNMSTGLHCITGTWDITPMVKCLEIICSCQSTN